MGRRTLLLIASLLVAALGTALVWLYVQGADNRAKSSYTPVQVWVATEEISSGTSGRALTPGTNVTQKQFYSVALPQDAVTDLVSVKDLKVISPIYPGQPLVKAQFGQTGDSPRVVDLGTGKMAISIQLADPNRVAGLLKPGSLVAVFGIDVKSTLTGENDHSVEVILPSVKVLTTGSTVTVPQPTSGTASGGSTGVSTAIVTLEVDQPQATKLLLGQTAGDLYFTLLEGPKAAPTTGSAQHADQLLK